MLNSIASFMIGMIKYSSPLLFASLGVLVMETSGMLCMAGEGMMIIGSFAGVAVTSQSGNIWIGLLAAMLFSGAFGAVFAFLAINFHIDQTVLGIAFNLVGAGLTTTLNRSFLKGTTLTQHFWTDGIGFSPVIYLGFAMVLAIWVIFYKTKLGIKLRSVGENPAVVESVGISVNRLRYGACIAGSMLVGIGGAFLSTGLLSSFQENMTEGRGFLALAAVTFGNYTPLGTLIGVLIFGVGEMLSYRLQVAGSVFPYEFALMLPYILVILALTAFVKNVHDPASLAVPYRKSK